MEKWYWLALADEMEELLDRDRPTYAGLCGYLSCEHYDAICLFRDTQWLNWEHYSGTPEYPVPHPSKEISASVAYSMTPFSSFYDESTEYGRLRRDLIEHLIEQIRQHWE